MDLLGVVNDIQNSTANIFVTQLVDSNMGLNNGPTIRLKIFDLDVLVHLHATTLHKTHLQVPKPHIRPNHMVRLHTKGEYIFHWNYLCLETNEHNSTPLILKIQQLTHFGLH